MNKNVKEEICEMLYHFTNDYKIPKSKYAYARWLWLCATMQEEKFYKNEKMEHYFHIKNNIKKYEFFCQY